ncbi:aprataxin-like [Oscarella lobularis]|uniref:aprataxin-like n=1 Tax=Oscarella lobularis TaxID=121494 RepID=UPI0033132540
MDDPTQRVDSDDRIVIIKDGFPKARHHYLVLARADVESLAKVGREHVPLLEHMQAKARELATRIRDEATPNAPRPQFRIGYHAVPSMRRLHLHVVSQDFDSPCLKHKKHWHSFTSDFFMESSDVIALLKREGRVTIDRDYYEGLLKRPLACHRCGRATATMPALKDHIRTHDR